MTDPFATALAALLRAPGSVAAVYTPTATDVPAPLRLIRHQASSDAGLTIGRAVRDGNTLTIAIVDVALPSRGDTVQIGTETLTVLADPLLDDEGLSWSVQAA